MSYPGTLSIHYIFVKYAGDRAGGQGLVLAHVPAYVRQPQAWENAIFLRVITRKNGVFPSA